MSLRSTVLVLSLVLAPACGGISDLPDSGGGDSGGGDGGGGGDAAPGPDCPSSAPSEGTACGKSGVECEYGSDTRWSCNLVTICSGGQWTLTKGVDPTCPTPSPNPPVCPATYVAAQQGGGCDPIGTVCDYSTSAATHVCSCAYLGGPVQIDGGGATWQCGGPYDQSCPAKRPRVGAPCSSPSTYCSYDVCGAPDGLSVQCDAQTGTWKTSPGPICAGAN